MALKQTIRSTTIPKTTIPETTNTTSVTNAQHQAMIDQGVTAALAARDANRSTNGDDNHNSGTCVRRTERATRECTYTDFLKCQPLNFKGKKDRSPRFLNQFQITLSGSEKGGLRLEEEEQVLMH
ncbi:hypothetical protein Tco_1512173 [Tanacetum coccineum]